MSFLTSWDFIKNQSLINKMRMLNIVGVAIAMLVVLVVLSGVYTFNARNRLSDTVAAQASLLALNSAPMLAFQDFGEATKLATSFKEVAELQKVAIYDQQNVPIVDLVTSGESQQLYFIQDRLPNIHVETIRFEEDSLLVFAPIYIEDERMGTVVLESSLDHISKYIKLFLKIATIATILGILLSAFILRKLQMWALGPILDMANLAEQVAIDKNYHLRVKIEGKDEVARLGHRFNEMLERIEIWDKDLNDEIDLRRKSERYLDRLARTDELTKLPNRLDFMDDLKKSVDEAIKGTHVFALMFIDLDDFKQVNDTQGHLCGDHVLQVTSQRISGVLRDFDKLYRLGGDEFAAIVKNVTEDEQAFLLSERLFDSISKPVTFVDEKETMTARIGASVGLAFCPTHAKTTTDLLHRADLAMYTAKRGGKNTLKIFDKEMEP